MKKTVLFILGFISGLLILASIFALIQEYSGRTFIPRGAGWLTIPIIFGYLSLLFLEDRNFSIKKEFFKTTFYKYFLFFSAIWIIFVILYVLVFEPFGYSMVRYEYIKLIKIILFPIVLSLVAKIVYLKIFNSR